MSSCRATNAKIADHCEVWAALDVSTRLKALLELLKLNEKGR